MNVRKSRQICIEQCEAAQTIKAQFGLTAAFDYLVGEKLMSFTSTASRHPDFAQELPRFVSEVRRMSSRRMRLAQSWRKSSVRKAKGTLMFWKMMIFFVRVRPQSRSAFSSSCWSRNC